MITPARALAIGAAALRHPWASRTTIEDFQSRALVRLVAHAYAHVPCYRALYDRHGVHPRDIRSLADLPKLPLASKEDFRGRPPAEITAANMTPSRLITAVSSGSTGQPTRVHRTATENAVQHVFRLRAERALGLRPGDRFARISNRRLRDPRDRKLLGPVLRKLGIYRPATFHLEPPKDLLERLAAFGPDVIYTFANVLLELGRALEDGHRARLRPRLLISTAEVLTPAMRAEIGQAWGVPVYDWYGSSEAGWLAHECPRAGDLHVMDDSAIVEILRDGRPAQVGERGEVVVTALHHHAMPFIRYRHGDIATRGPGTCACGRPFSKIGAIRGRMVDFFRLPGGRWAHPYDILSDLSADGVEWVERYQLVQEREDRLNLRLAVRPGTPPERVTRFEQAAGAVVGPDVRFTVEVVPHIDPGPGGKLRPSRSLVRSAYDTIDWEGAGLSRLDDRA